ncbi:protein lifeguard 4-like [Tropilaelaps mercedesae]|uniref:Protein lifeguard 4-like n=1 Tax=Tropilaelaps mercedesae TaxID=418985 RepID=A0A1V9X4K6_9ACAR|nr:protein lifeguard 4-like [Tropilaelaps mercedesae]
MQMRDSLLSVDGEPTIQDDFSFRNPVAKAHVTIRMGFLRKVYGILSLQLLVAVVLTAVAMFLPPVRLFISENHWMLPMSFVLSMATLLGLFVKRRETPANYILLGFYTVLQAYTISVVVSFYDQLVVLHAFLLTLTVTAALTVFTLQTKWDFTAMPAVLLSFLLVLILGQLMNALFPSSSGELLLSIFGAGLFSMFIVVDTQMIMHRSSPEDYMLATVELYMDILNLFLHILRILGERK